LPALSPVEAIAALNASGLNPDPDELWQAYCTVHSPTPEAAAVLAHLQLVVRAGRWANERQVADFACVSNAHVSRMVNRLSAAGLLAISGGKQGPTGRGCYRYRLTWSPAITLKPHRWLQARTWAWARQSNVPAKDAAMCLRQGKLDRLQLLVSAARLTRPSIAPPPAPIAAARIPSQPAALGATPIGDVLRHRLEHGFSSSQEALSRPTCSEGYRASEYYSESPESAGARAPSPGRSDDSQPVAGRALEATQGPRRDFLKLAESLKDNAPRSTWRMVVGAARRLQVPLEEAVSVYERCAFQARVEAREGRVHNAAGWATRGFLREVQLLQGAA
jgi:hypothetical protein